MDFYVNPHVKNMERIFPMQGRYGYQRYDMNENPEGLPHWFVQEVLTEITPTYLSTYPEPQRFIEKYAEFLQVQPDNVTVTNGSDQAIRYLLQVFGQEGGDCITVAPSFEMYWVNCKLLGINHIPIPYEEDLSFDMEKLLDAITPNTNIVVLLNPNNPVGNAFSRDEVEAVVAKAEEHGAVVIIDEAYHYFFDATFLDLAISRPNVIVLRTFSKLFSLAACRIGAVIANPQIIHYVNNLKLTFDVNAIALKFAERILDHPTMVQELIDSEKEGRRWILQALTDLGYCARRCEGNFIFVEPKNPAPEVARALEDNKVLVKSWNNGDLSRFIRVSTGSKEAMEKFLDAFLEADS